MLIDNTARVVTLGNQQRNGSLADVDLEAVDKTSPLLLCEYSVDAGNWQPIETVDGITDSPQEKIHVHLEKLGTGEHLLVIRVYDVAGNAGLAKMVLRGDDASSGGAEDSKMESGRLICHTNLMWSSSAMTIITMSPLFPRSRDVIRRPDRWTS